MDQDDASLGGIWRERTDVELTIVKRDRERIVSKRRGAVDERAGGMRNPIPRIIRRMRMEFDFQHL